MTPGTAGGNNEFVRVECRKGLKTGHAGTVPGHSAPRVGSEEYSSSARASVSPELALCVCCSDPPLPPRLRVPARPPRLSCVPSALGAPTEEGALVEERVQPPYSLPMSAWRWGQCSR